MNNLYFTFAEFIKNEVVTNGNAKFFTLDCLKFNFGFFDSYSECNWSNKLIIDIPTIDRMSVKELAVHIEMNVNMYAVKRMEDLLNNGSK